MRHAALVLTLALAVGAPAAIAKNKPPKPPKAGGANACTITGTAGNDFLFDSAGDDVVCGLGGNDTLAGGRGNDTLVGGDGHDLIDGGPGADRLRGGSGNDTLRAFDRERDVVEGGRGYDTAWVDRRLDRMKGVEALA